MKLTQLPRLWKQTPWGALWGMALVVMIGSFFFTLMDGFSLPEAIVWGVLCGPGFLAITTIVSLLASLLTSSDQ
jgi:hypothetical protein